jgi:DNA-binding NarL/FixJ family response regulator
VAGILVLSADLLFGSRLQADMARGGHDLELIGDESRLRTRLVDPQAPKAQVLIGDLTDDRLDGASILEALAADGLLGELRTLAFYSHVDAAVRARAEQAGFDLVVPRSRMAREGPALLSGLL